MTRASLLLESSYRDHELSSLNDSLGTAVEGDINQSFIWSSSFPTSHEVKSLAREARRRAHHKGGTLGRKRVTQHAGGAKCEMQQPLEGMT